MNLADLTGLGIFPPPRQGVWSPTVSSLTGSFTGHTLTNNGCSFIKIKQWCIAQFDITLTALGSGSPAGTLSVSLPIMPTSRGCVLGFEFAITNATLRGTIAAGAQQVDVVKLADSTTIIQTGARVIVGPFAYKVA